MGRRPCPFPVPLLQRDSTMPRLPVKYDWPRVVLLVRERRSETQAEFADALGCSVSTVSKWERGETVPAPKQRRRMEAMGVEAGLPSAEWPHETRQTNLFDEGQR